MIEQASALARAPIASTTGKQIRLSRLIDVETTSCRIVALDHGLTSPIFLSGLADMGRLIGQVIDGGANVLMLSRGSARSYWSRFAGRAALALMLTASAAGRPGGASVTAIGSVEEALRLGADAVVVYVALAGEDEPEMIRYLSAVGEACERFGMPLIAEAEYPDAYAMDGPSRTSLGPDYLVRNARLCYELGADIVKVNWSGDPESFANIVDACGCPVVLAGGPLLPDEELIRRMDSAHESGAVGYSVGRNIFENADPRGMTEALTKIFRSPPGSLCRSHD